MGLTAVRLAGVAAAPGVARGPWVHVRRRELPVGGRVAPDAVDGGGRAAARRRERRRG